MGLTLLSITIGFCFFVTISCFAVLLFLVTLFPFLSHPLAMGLTLLSITIGVALIMGTVYTSYWLPYCLVLILLGGYWLFSFMYLFWHQTRLSDCQLRPCWLHRWCPWLVDSFIPSLTQTQGLPLP